MKTAAHVVFPQIRLDRRSPLQRQIYEALRAAVLQGRLPGGFRLPASRALAAKLGVSRNTVLFAYEELIADGLLAGRIGSGTRIERTASLEFTDPDGQRLFCAGRAFRA